MSDVTITVTVDTCVAEALLACVELIQDDPPIMEGHLLRVLAERLWGATVIPGSASPDGPADDARPEIMPGFFDDTEAMHTEAHQWRMVAYFLRRAANSIDAHLDKLGIDPL